MAAWHQAPSLVGAHLVLLVVGSGEEGNIAFLVLEYFEGPTLSEMLKQRGRFGPRAREEPP